MFYLFPIKANKKAPSICIEVGNNKLFDSHEDVFVSFKNPAKLFEFKFLVLTYLDLLSFSPNLPATEIISPFEF